MVRSALGKVAWVGRTASMVLGLAVVLALVVGLADAALGANGQAWVLGQVNRATSTTQLNANVAGKAALLVANSNKAPASRALHLNVAQGKAPMAVNSDTRVLNLNADKVDGVDATSFVRGNGTAYRGAVDLARGSGFSNLILDTNDPTIGLQYSCPNDLSTLGTVAVLNRTFVDGAQTANLFVDDGSTNPSYQSLPSGRVANVAAAPNGEHITVQAQVPGPKVVNMEVFSVHRPASNDCHVEAQAIVTR
jgi:hypothetical protein